LLEEWDDEPEESRPGLYLLGLHACHEAALKGRMMKGSGVSLPGRQEERTQGSLPSVSSGYTARPGGGPTVPRSDKAIPGSSRSFKKAGMGRFGRAHGR